MNILEQYEMRAPTGQNVIDLFAGEWSSAMPEQSGLRSTPGTAKLFDDGRITCAEEVFGKFADRRILELGPLEGAHTYMLIQRGVREVVAVEANTRAYLKCLCVKELFGLHEATFLLGDFVPYMEQLAQPFDIVFASGVLYHMTDPMRVLDLICNSADKVLLWTHYFDESVLRSNPILSPKFSDAQSASHGDFEYRYAIQSYNDALNWAGFCGGSEPHSRWLERDSILEFLRLRGFGDVRINFDHPAHPNGPAFAIAAQR